MSKTARLYCESSQFIFTKYKTYNKDTKEFLPIPALEYKVETASNGMLLKGVPVTILDKTNANNRIYSTEVINAAIKKVKENKEFESKTLACALDHPAAPLSVPTYEAGVSHAVVNAYIKEVNGDNVLFNDWFVYNTQKGKELQELVKGGAGLGTSIRGLVFDVTQEGADDTEMILDYQFLGTDVVTEPSSRTYLNMFDKGETIKGKRQESTDTASLGCLPTGNSGIVDMRDITFNSYKDIEDYIKRKKLNKNKISIAKFKKENKELYKLVF